MIFFEYDPEAEKRVVYEDGYAEGFVRSCMKHNLSKEFIIKQLSKRLLIPINAATSYYIGISEDVKKEALEAQQELEKVIQIEDYANCRKPLTQPPTITLTLDDLIAMEQNNWQPTQKVIDFMRQHKDE